MTGMLLLGVVVGMMAGCGGKRSETKTAETPSASTMATAPALVAEDPGGGGDTGGTRNFWVGDGPTEFRVGGKIVGVGYGDHATGVETIYMFEKVPAADPVFGDYPKHLAPTRVPIAGVNAGVRMSSAKLKDASGGDCDSTSCFANTQAFNTGYRQHLATLYPSAQVPAAAKAVGSPRTSTPYASAVCSTVAPNIYYIHADAAKDSAGTIMGWQLVEKDDKTPPLVHNVTAVMKNGVNDIRGLDMVDAAPPPDGPTWCNNLAAECWDSAKSESLCHLLTFQYTFQ